MDIMGKENTKGSNITILIVDDSEASVILMRHILKKHGYPETLVATSAAEAFSYLGISGDGRRHIDLILLDVVMPEIDGIEALTRIKEVESLSNVPVIMVTADDTESSLSKAFDLGAVDYVKKPFNKTEFIARIRSALRLKVAWDKQIELTKKLEKMTLVDGLTGASNRRHFDRVIESEWKRAYRNNGTITLIMIDIDHFKKYNDSYGHLHGDDCLKKVARALLNVARRPTDTVARYGGEEFAVILPETDDCAARILAEKARHAVESLATKHNCSDISGYVTISLGVATMTTPENDSDYKSLIKNADEALYNAKEEGRNRVKIFMGGKKKPYSG